MPSERRNYTLVCRYCNQPFHPLRKQSVYCSRTCQARHFRQQGILRSKTRQGVECRCEGCGTAFYVAAHRQHTAKYCSRSCLARVHLAQFAAHRFQPQSTAPHRYTTMMVDGKQVRVHRYLMEQHLGRKLTRDEHVHHINGDPTDNRLDNLMVLSNAAHQKLEHAERKARKKRP